MKRQTQKKKAQPGKSKGPFARVWELVARVPRGRVITYGELSQMLDRRLSPVGIGWAMRAAPEDSIPWQRVVNASGGISTDRENPGLQRAMLEAEGVVFDRDGRIDLERFGWRQRRARRLRPSSYSRGSARGSRSRSASRGRTSRAS